MGRYVLDAVPLIHTPVNTAGRESLDAQNFPDRHRADFVIESPHQEGRDGLVDQVALHRLWRKVEELTVLKRALQSDALGVCPDERHS